MSTVQATNTNLFTNSAASTSATKKDAAEEAQDRFLKLLVTQMQNQDPLNPLDNAEVTSQLAQISTVTGIDRLNDTLQQLLSGIEDSRTMEAATLVGRNVLVPGNTMELVNDNAAAGIELTQPVDNLTVTILDASGIAVRTMDLGAQPTGINTFNWNGLTDGGTAAANGQYSFVVSAQQGDRDIKVNTLTIGAVKGVSPGEHDAVMDMGNLGLVGFNEIKQIY